MTNFENTVTINKPIEDVYAFLTDMNNHKALMPDNVVEWSSTKDEASFNIQGITKLSIKISERIINEVVKIIPVEKPPFDLEIKWVLSAQGNSTKATFSIAADLNMMMKMVASSPLKKLASEETSRLEKLLNN